MEREKSQAEVIADAVAQADARIRLARDSAKLAQERARLYADAKRQADADERDARKARAFLQSMTRVCANDWTRGYARTAGTRVRANQNKSMLADYADAEF